MILVFKQIYNIDPSEKRRSAIRNVTGNADDVSD